MSSTLEDIMTLFGGLGLIAASFGGWIVKWILIFALGFLAYQTNPKWALIILGVLLFVAIVVAFVNALIQWAKNKN